MANLPVRARDLRSNILSMGFEKGIVHTLELMLEEHSAMKQTLRDISEVTGLCVSQIEFLLKIGEGMQNRITEIQRTAAQGEDDGS